MLSIGRRLRFSLSSRPGDICALAYHSIGESVTPLTITPNMFNQQMQWLKANATLVSAENLRKYLAGGALPPKSVLVTFDDGYQDNLTTALPILKKHDIPALVFVCTGFVGARIPLYSEMLPALSWNDIRTLHSSGQVELGAHTSTHPRLTDVSEYVVRKTILDSKAALEQAVEIPIVSFCYPHGLFNRSVIGVVREAGFQIAFGGQGLVSRRSSRFALPRLQIDRSTSVADLAANIGTMC